MQMHNFQEQPTQRVNRLRKEGRLQEALELARALFREQHNDIWVLRAYGWALNAALWEARKADCLPQAQELVKEFQQLNLPEDEDRLIDSRTQHAEACGPGVHVRSALSKLQRDKQHDEVWRQGRAWLRKQPGDHAMMELCGWSWRALAWEEVTRNEPNGSKVSALLHEAMELLMPVKKASALHSALLTVAIKAGPDCSVFLPFVKKWDLQFLRPDDYQPFAKEGQNYPSLVERLVKALYRAVKIRPVEDEALWAANFVGQQLKRFPEQEWFPFYYGRLLTWSKQCEKARAYLLPILRQKQTEFWAWQALGGTLGEQASAQRMACLCRAMLCRVHKPEFLLHVREELAQLFLDHKQPAQAACEIREMVKIRKEHSWPIPALLQELQADERLKGIVAEDSNDAFYRQQAPLADELLLEGLPVVPAVVTRVGQHDDGKRFMVVSMWHKRQIVTACLQNNRFRTLKKVVPGDVLKLRTGDDGRVVQAEFSSEPALKELKQAFSGPLTIRDGNSFGFVADCFVPPFLLGKAGVQHDDSVTVTAVRTIDKKHNRPGWQAVTLEKDI